MIGSVDTYIDSGTDIPEKYVIYYSNSDFEYAIPIGGRCRLTLDRNLGEWIKGVVIKIDLNSFVLQEDNGEKISILCNNIYDIHCEEEIGIIS